MNQKHMQELIVRIETNEKQPVTIKDYKEVSLNKACRHTNSKVQGLLPYSEFYYSTAISNTKLQTTLLGRILRKKRLLFSFEGW